MTERKRIILDVDTGSDDAIALVCALLSKECEVLGIATVGGNVELKNTTDNTLRVVECCGRQDVGVYAGAALPLASTLVPFGLQAAELPRREGTRDQETAVHTDHLPLPPTRLAPQKTCAAVWLIQTLLAAEDGSVTLVPVGPITNLALALRADERIVPKIREIVLMGGSHDVYAPSQAAEFNVWCDPEALEIVLQSGIPVTMVSLDATSHALLSREQAARIRAVGTPPALLVAELVKQRLHASEQMGAVRGASVGAAIHDALAVCAALHPEVLTQVDFTSCHVDLGRGYAYGETVLSRNYKNGIVMPPNCRYARAADSEFFFRWLLSVLESAR